MTDKVIASDRYSDATTDATTCKHCGNEMTLARTGPKKMYCNKRCKTDAENAASRERRAGQRALDAKTEHTAKGLENYMALVHASVQRQQRRKAMRA